MFLQITASTHLAKIIGLAISNDTTENANFTASHLLCCCRCAVF